MRKCLLVIGVAVCLLGNNLGLAQQSGSASSLPSKESRDQSRHVISDDSPPFVDSEEIIPSKTKASDKTNAISGKPKNTVAVVDEQNQGPKVNSTAIKMTASDSSLEARPTNKDSKVQQTTFKSPSSFLAVPKAAQKKPDTDFVAIDQLSVNRQSAPSQSAFVNPTEFKSIINNLQFKAEQVQVGPVEPKRHVAAKSAHSNEIQSRPEIAIEFPTEPVTYRFRDYRVSRFAQDEKEDVKKWTMELGAPISKQVLSRVVPAPSTDKLDKPVDHAADMKYESTAVFHDGARATDDVVWSHRTKLWDAPNFYHRPLYFQDENLERYGQVRRLQSARSAIHFFGRIPVIHYMAGIKLPNERMYSLGYYRPGNCNPAFAHDVPVNRRAIIFQSLATTGIIGILP